MRKTTLPIIAFIFLMAINHSLQSQPTTIKSFTQNFEKKEGFLIIFGTIIKEGVI